MRSLAVPFLLASVPPSHSLPRPALRQNNNFGVLRLLLASLVLVSHSSELIDGNRSRELLMNLVATTVTFGELAVDGFFIVSGYLVLQSFQSSSSTLDYLRKRVLRIYPGFIVCTILVVAFSPFVGASFDTWSWKTHVRVIFDIATLNVPYQYAYPNLPFHALNGSAWSIIYEFRCYLLIPVLAFALIFSSRWLLLAVTALLMISHAVAWPTYIGPLARLVGYPPLFVRMSSLFCAGMCFYMFCGYIRYDWRIAVACAIALFFALHYSAIAEPAFAIFGGYLIFWFALGLRSKTLAAINNKNDISYGTYLYAWPIAGALIYFFWIRSPVLLFALTLPLSLFAGYASWHLVEKRFAKKRSMSRHERTGSDTRLSSTEA